MSECRGMIYEGSYRGSRVFVLRLFRFIPAIFSCFLLPTTTVWWCLCPFVYVSNAQPCLPGWSVFLAPVCGKVRD